MERRLVAVSILAVIALGVVAAFFVLRAGSDEDTSLASLSARERPVEIPAPERVGPPGSPMLTGEELLIAERGGLRFVRLPREDGSSCWSTADKRSGEWQLVSYWCETGFTRFPDPKQPLVMTGRVQTIPGTQLMVWESIAGFAADGVERIGFVDARDRLVEVTSVVDNVFFAPRAPSDRVKAVAAIDEAGEVIWRSPGVQLPDE